MEIKLIYLKVFNHKPVLSEFIGTTEEFESLIKKGYITEKEVKN